MLLVWILPPQLFAGDAVVVGYNADGLWTAVTYFASSTPKGGRDYKDKAQAREHALRDLKRRGGPGMVRSTVLSDSDATGYVAVARGTNGDADVNVVGRGKTPPEADAAAVSQLKEAGADSKQKIVYRYFSYGADSK